LGNFSFEHLFQCSYSSPLISVHLFRCTYSSAPKTIIYLMFTTLEQIEIYEFSHRFVALVNFETCLQIYG